MRTSPPEVAREPGPPTRTWKQVIHGVTPDVQDHDLQLEY